MLHTRNIYNMLHTIKYNCCKQGELDVPEAQTDKKELSYRIHSSNKLSVLYMQYIELSYCYM